MSEVLREIKLPTLISDGMVFQRDTDIKLWGWAPAGEELLVSFLDREYKTTVARDGRWELVLPPHKAGGPYEMTLRCLELIRVIKNICIGDIWVLGGQSNMEIPVSRTLDLFEDEVKNARCAEIRKFGVPQKYNFHGPVEELDGGEWVEVTPNTVKSFSAVGYFFAKKLYDKYRIPIGLIHTAIGGTPAEAWMSEETLKKFDNKYQELLNQCKDDEYVNGTKLMEEQRNLRWYEELDRLDKGLGKEDKPWYQEELDVSDWTDIELPNSFMGTELEEVKGSVWFRKEIDIPESMAGKPAKLLLGTIIDGDDTYLNGVKIGSTGYQYPPRRYPIPKGLLKPGRNVLAVRVLLTLNVGGFVTDMPYFIRADKEEVSIAGTWKYKIGAVTGALEPITFFQYKPCGVFNNMIYPLRNHKVRGFLWYQGESNTREPYGYKELFQAVIEDWRANWGQGYLPFNFVQLSNFCLWKLEPEVSGWARLREEQRRALAIPNTGMAVTIDVGHYNELHPWDKKSVGERLALWTMKQVFHEDVVCSGPIYDHMKVEGSHIRLYFNYVGGGLTIKGDELKTFMLSGKDGNFLPAKAQIDGDTVLVWAEGVEEPVAVRYAWADNPEEANLYNKEGLPASPFTTEP